MAGLFDLINSPAGMGLLSAVAGGFAGARQGTPFNNVGRGMVSGLSGYAQANDQIRQDEENAFQKQFRQTQMEQMQRQLADQQKMRESLHGLYKPAGTEQFQADNPFGEDLGKLQNETQATFGGKPVDPVMAAVLPYAQPDDILKMFGPNMQDKTAEQKNWEFAQNLPADQREQFMARSGGGSTPATIQEWNAYTQMGPEERSQFLEMKRAPQVLNLGGSMAVRAPGGGIGESYAVAPKVTELPDYAAQVAAAETGAKESVRINAGREEKRIEAESKLPQVLDSAAFTRKMVKGVIEHPAFASSVGARVPGLEYIPGSPQADFKSRLDQLKGDSFLTAFANLKGGGSITETEGKKAETAVNRMSTATSEQEFKLAAQDFLSVVDAVERRSLTSAGKAPKQAAPAQANRPAAALPTFGEVRNGYRFIGGKNANPKDPKNWQKVK